MFETEPTSDVAALTVQLLSAYLANNTVPAEAIADLIVSTRDALTGGSQTLAQAEPEAFTPAVSVRKSLASPHHIISLIDGKPYKTLKRHLMGHGLTPEAYRNRYNLSASYPMVAPTYAEQRRNIEQNIGLGIKKSAAGGALTPEDNVSCAIAVGNTGATQPKSSRDGIAEMDVSTAIKKSKASSTSKAAAVNEARLDQRASTAGLDQAAASDAITSPAPTQQSSQDTLIPKARKGRATSGTELPGTKTSGARATKGRSDKLRIDMASGTEPSSQTLVEESSAGVDQQNVQARAQKPTRRAKLGLFAETGSKKPA